MPNTVGVVLLGLGRFYDGYRVRSGCPGCVLLCAAGREVPNVITNMLINMLSKNKIFNHHCLIFSKYHSY